MGVGDERTDSFGYWLRRRRKALDLTQEALAARVACSRFTIRKIEADERRPSRMLALRLAERLAVPPEERAAFLAAARALQVVAAVPLPVTPLVVADPAVAPADAIGAAGPGGPALQEGLPFVGRASELARFQAWLQDPVLRVALVDGEAGIGKSRLLTEFARAATGSHQVLITACYEIEQGMPYQPLIELVTGMLAAQPALSTRLPARIAAELATVVPALAAQLPVTAVTDTGAPEARQSRLFHAFEHCFRTFALQGSLTLAFDDFHWVDEATLQFVHAFARHLHAAPLRLLLAFRDEEMVSRAALSAFIGRLKREPAVLALSLGRLSAVDTEAVVRAAGSAFAAPAIGAWLHRETAGHPFFLVSILQSLAERATPLDDATLTANPLPAALLDAVRARLAPLDADQRDVLDRAAILGRRVEFALLQAVLQCDEHTLLVRLEALLQRRLLREVDGDHYDFTHDKIREAVYADIGAARRKILHREVAMQLEAFDDMPLDERAPALAEHYSRAERWPEAIGFLAQAAQRALRLFATGAALDLLDRAVTAATAHPRAVSDDTRTALLEQRGGARALAGRIDGAVADLEAVLATARAQGDPVRVRDLLIRLGMAHRRGDDYAAADRCLTEALAACRARQDAAAAADTLYHLGTVAWSSGRNVDALRYHEEAVALCGRLDLANLVAVQAWHGLGEAQFADARPVAAIESFTRSLNLARAVGDRAYEAENLMMIGWACLGSMGLGDYPRAIESLNQGLAIAERAGLSWHLGPLCIARDFALAAQGHYASAWAGLAGMMTELEEAHLARYFVMACNMAGHVLLDLGLDAQALQVVERGLFAARARQIAYWMPLLHANCAIAKMRLGDLAVEEALQAALAVALDTRDGWFLPRLHEALAELAWRRGDAGNVRVQAMALRRLAARGNLQEVALRAERWLAEAQAFTDPAAALAHVQSAHVRSDALGLPGLSLALVRAAERFADAAGAPEIAASCAREAAAIATGLSTGLARTPLAHARP
ncbi:MAG: AAA family ATPase [Gammaproteobacteria bacterium]